MKNDNEWCIGAYLVRLQASAASPSSMPLFYVFLDGEFVGKSVSMPSESDCDWLRRCAFEGTLYASVSIPPAPKLRGICLSRNDTRRRRGQKASRERGPWNKAK